MTIHIVNEMFSYVPELQGLVKSASDMEKLEGFPTDTKDLTLLSLAKISYMSKVAGMDVPSAQELHVKRACKLYGITDTLEQALTLLGKGTLEKKASEMEKTAEVKATLMQMEDLSRHGKVEQLVKAARALDEEYGHFEDIAAHPYLMQYTGKGPMSKEACLSALEKRRLLVGGDDFEKVASVLAKQDFSKFSQVDKVKVLDTIQGLDKAAGINFKGYNIYEETMMVKAAENVNLGKGKSVPVQRVLDVAPALQDALGKDVVKELQEAGANGSAQAVIDSLPMDLKAIISRYV